MPSKHSGSLEHGFPFITYETMSPHLVYKCLFRTLQQRRRGGVLIETGAMARVTEEGWQIEDDGKGGVWRSQIKLGENE